MSPPTASSLKLLKSYSTRSSNQADCSSTPLQPAGRRVHYHFVSVARLVVCLVACLVIHLLHDAWQLSGSQGDRQSKLLLDRVHPQLTV